MSTLVFMSAAHVARMNELLAADAASKAACAALERRHDMVYELAAGAETVWWTMRFDPIDGVSFNLLPPTETPDILFRGNHRAVLEVMRRLKAGEKDLQLPLMQSGDPAAMSRIAAAYAAAHQAAAIQTEIP